MPSVVVVDVDAFGGLTYLAQLTGSQDNAGVLRRPVAVAATEAALAARTAAEAQELPCLDLVRGAVAQCPAIGVGGIGGRYAWWRLAPGQELPARHEAVAVVHQRGGRTVLEL